MSVDKGSKPQYPVLVSTDGAPGLIRAVEKAFPKSLRQPSLAHKMRNLEAKVGGDVWRELKGAAYAAYQAGRPQARADGEGVRRHPFQYRSDLEISGLFCNALPVSPSEFDGVSQFNAVSGRISL